MAGIQISGLISDAAFDWKSVVDQLMEVNAVPVTRLEKQQANNNLKVAALADLTDAFSDLQTSAQSLRSSTLFQSRLVNSDNASTTWKALGTAGAPVGSYKIAVSQLATNARLQGTAGISQSLATTSDVSGLTIASLPLASAITAGSFTVNGQQISVALTDSLDDVFTAISTATGGEVTAAYNATTDRVTLTDSSGELVLGAGNDTSNFLATLKLANTGTGTSTSTAALAALQTSRTLSALNLDTAITAIDGTGAGTFSINGVAIAYNVNTDTLGSVIARINDSSAGVTARYDSAADRVVLTNDKTGDLGMGITETTGGLLGALGLTTGTPVLVRGKNAEFSLNDGATLTSASNTLDAATHGVTGLSITVNSTTTQTIAVSSDTGVMEEAIQDFIDQFNAVQTLIEESTKVTSSGGKVTTSVLSDNREVQQWARELRSAAFDSLSSLTGDITRLDHLGVDFNGITGQLVIKDAAKLAKTLSDTPDQVSDFFQSGSNGFVSRLNTLLVKVMRDDMRSQTSLNSDTAKLGDQITTLQRRLEAERERLTASFIAMQSAQSAAQSQAQTLTNAFFSDNND